MRTADLPAETQSDLRHYFRPPVLRHQLERSLEAEFGTRICATSWESYRDPLPSYAGAARVIKATLAAISNRGDVLSAPGTAKGNADYIQYHGVDTKSDYLSRSAEADAWVKQECTTLLKELTEGDYSRWERIELLLGEEGLKGLSPNHLEMMRPAAKALGMNPSLHPRLKREVLLHIRSVILEATAKQ